MRQIRIELFFFVLSVVIYLVYFFMICNSYNRHTDAEVYRTCERYLLVEVVNINGTIFSNSV